MSRDCNLSENCASTLYLEQIDKNSVVEGRRNQQIDKSSMVEGRRHQCYFKSVEVIEPDTEFLKIKSDNYLKR